MIRLPSLMRRWRRTLCVLPLGLCGLAWADATPTQVQQLLQRGQHTQALQLIDQGLQRTPNRPDLTFYRGVALTELHRDDEALAVFRELNRAYPDSPEPLNNLGVLLARQNQWTPALEALQAALKIDPQYQAAHENLGDVYARLAALAYQNALKSPDGPAGHAQTKLRLVAQIAPLPAPAPLDLPATEKTPVSATPMRQANATPMDTAGAQVPGTVAPSPDVAQVHAALQRWADAWSRRDMAAYAASYTDGYATAGLTHAQWLAQRRARIEGKTSIQVELDAVKVQVNGDRATVQFVQRYTANDHRSVDRKTVTMHRQGDAWRIAQERNR